MADTLNLWFRDQGILMLTGIFVTYISSFLYTMNAQGFLSRGKYRKKEDAILIFLGSTLILGAVTPILYWIAELTLTYIPPITIFGILIIGTNYVLHYSIPTWKQTSTKSLLIYLLGTFLIILGCLISIYF
jgi:cytochrome bd-type quinol oxidase subunit 2